MHMSTYIYVNRKIENEHAYLYGNIGPLNARPASLTAEEEELCLRRRKSKSNNEEEENHQE